MDNLDFVKLQNDEYRLLDFIRDKYERKRYAPKGKDPMTLVIEGKEIKEYEKPEEK